MHIFSSGISAKEGVTKRTHIFRVPRADNNTTRKSLYRNTRSSNRSQSLKEEFYKIFYLASESKEETNVIELSFY